MLSHDFIVGRHADQSQRVAEFRLNIQKNQKKRAQEQRQKEENMEMLKAEDIAASILYTITQPKRCDVVTMQIRPHLQSI